MISPTIWGQFVHLPPAPRGSTLDPGLCDDAGSQFSSQHSAVVLSCAPALSLAQIPFAVLLAGHMEPFLQSPRAAPGQLRRSRGSSRSSSVLQRPTSLPTAKHHMESTCSGDRWCSLPLQCHHLALAEQSVMENWISVLGTPVHPSAKSRSKTSPPRTSHFSSVVVAYV